MAEEERLDELDILCGAYNITREQIDRLEQLPMDALDVWLHSKGLSRQDWIEINCFRLVELGTLEMTHDADGKPMFRLRR